MKEGNWMNLKNDCHCDEVSQINVITDFNCGDSDLNDFFNHDALLFKKQMLGQTHFFRHIESGKIVCAFSISADSIKTGFLPSGRRGKVKQLIPHEKSLQSYPSFLIGRLGVSMDFGGQGIGSQLMKYIVFFCNKQFPDLGRFLVVDAYNKPDVLKFYLKNGFAFVFSSEEQEKEYLKKSVGSSEPLHTRQMFYDMMRGKQD
jgi:predicted GNAT family N-acyltransferase